MRPISSRRNHHSPPACAPAGLSPKDYNTRLTLAKYVLFAVMSKTLASFDEKLARKLENNLSRSAGDQSIKCVRPSRSLDHDVLFGPLEKMDRSIDRSAWIDGQGNR